jgi:hypothetical protein
MTTFVTSGGSVIPLGSLECYEPDLGGGVGLSERCRQSKHFYVTSPQLPQSRFTVAASAAASGLGFFDEGIGKRLISTG